MKVTSDIVGGGGLDPSYHRKSVLNDLKKIDTLITDVYQKYSSYKPLNAVNDFFSSDQNAKYLRFYDFIDKLPLLKPHLKARPLITG